ncbi:MAG: carboxypeptidase regulatory-like domain-containing protein [Myxococcota bacterium]
MREAAAHPALDAAVRVRGEIRNAAGEPLERVAVSAAHWPRRDGARPTAEVKRVQTDKGGRFELELTLGSYALLAELAGFASARRQLDIAAPGSHETRLTLLRAGKLSGVARAADGKPVAEATVVAQLVDGLDSMASQPVTAHTDDRGRFELSQVPPGELQLSATKDALGTLSSVNVFVTPGGAQADIELDMQPAQASSTPVQGAARQAVLPASGEHNKIAGASTAAASISGTALDPFGNGVSGLSVIAVPFRSAGEPQLTSGSRAAWLTHTDANGAFLLAGVSPASYSLELHDAFGVLAFRQAPDANSLVRPISVQVRGGRAYDARLNSVACNGLLEGNVITDTGQPAANAAVHIRPAGETSIEPRFVAWANEHGVFSVNGLCRPAYDVFVSDATQRFSARGSEVQVRSRISLRLSRRSELRVVVQRAGVPVSEYSAELASASFWKLRRIRSSQGEFTDSALEPEPYQLTVIAADGYATRALHPEPSQPMLVNLELVGWSVVRGHVRDELGNPMQNVTVTVKQEPPSSFVRSGLRSSNNRLEPLARTDANGAFELPQVMAGPARLSFQREQVRLVTLSARATTLVGGLPATGFALPVSVPTGESVDVGEVRLMEAPTGARPP